MLSFSINRDEQGPAVLRDGQSGREGSSGREVSRCKRERPFEHEAITLETVDENASSVRAGREDAPAGRYDRETEALDRRRGEEPPRPRVGAPGAPAAPRPLMP